MPNNFRRSNLENISFIEVILVLIFVVLTTTFYFYFDTKSILETGAFPWDSDAYLQLAKTLHYDGNSSIKSSQPFSYRVLFPWLYGYIHNATGLSYIYSSFILNILSSWAVLLLSYVLWRRENCSKKLSWIGVIFFSIFWLGPIRQSIFYPSGAFAFEVLLVILLFFIMTMKFKIQLISIVFSIISVFILSLGREFISYILWSITLIHYIFIFIQTKFKIRNITLYRFVSNLVSQGAFKFTLMSASSLTAFVYVRSLVQVTEHSSYSIVEHIVTYGWFHLHIVEFLYPLFYALGPIFIIGFSFMAIKELRKKLFTSVVNSINHISLVVMFCFFGFIFGMLGGTDSDRFLLWFFPFFTLFALRSIEIMVAYNGKQLLFILFILIFSSLFFSRFYVPGTPNIFFPGNKYGSQANIKTNYSPSLYYGPTFMEKYRLPLQNVPLDDAFIYGGGVKNIEKLVQIPASISKNTEGNRRHWYKNHYKYNINNIPIPLGFPHNQYELFAAHPFYGGKVIKILFLLQWLFIFMLITMLLRGLLRDNKNK